MSEITNKQLSDLIADVKADTKRLPIIENQVKIIDQRLKLVEQRLANIEEWVPVSHNQLSYNQEQDVA